MHILSSSAGKDWFQNCQSFPVHREGFPDPLPIERLMMRECPYFTKTWELLGNPFPPASKFPSTLKRRGWISHSLIISREVLILTLSILPTLQGCISWYIPWYGLMIDERMAIHCLESRCIGLYIPSDLEISLGPRGCTTQYIPPLGSVRIQYWYH